MSDPINVSLLSTGANTRCFKYIKSWVFDNDGDWIDVRDSLHNPLQSAKAKFKEDGTFATTVQSIYSQAAFGPLAMKIVGDIENGNHMRIIGGNCTTGYHRIWVTMKSVSDMLNTLHNPDGTRRYNAQHFPLQHIDDKDDSIDTMLAHAKTWLTDPWMEMLGGPRNRAQYYGHDAVIQRPECYITFDLIWKYIESLNHDATLCLEDSNTDVANHGWPKPENVVEDEVVEVKGEGIEEAKGDAIDGAPLVGVGAGSSSAIWAIAEPPPPSKRVPPTPPPATKRVKLTPAQPSQPPPSASLPSASLRRGDVEEIKDAQHHEWKCTTAPFNPKFWAQVLNTFEIDDIAQMQLYLLAQLSDDGAWRANAIVGKLLTKRGKGETINNPSHFVHKCIQTARKVMGAPEHQH